MKKHRIIISGGGTGGHVFPAIAIGQAFKHQDSDTDLLFVGAHGKMEMEKVPQAGFAIKGLTVAGFQRKKIWKNWSLPFKLFGALVQSVWILLSFRPHAVIGVGGYASGPIVKIAQWFGIPTFLQEQNAFPGATNRMLGKKARTIFAGFPGLEKFFPQEKIVVSGNPVRPDLIGITKKQAEHFAHFGLDASKKVVLVIGGSLGAKTINEAIVHSYTDILALGYQLIWQTGKTYYAQYQHITAEGLWVGKFIDDMQAAYGIADVVISRAGALSIAEIVNQSIPTILVPSPNVTDDHQTKNARSVVEHGGGVLLPDADAKEQLFSFLEQLNDPGVTDQMEQAQRNLAHPNSAHDIVEKILETIQTA